MDAADIAEIQKFEVPRDTLGLHVLYDPKATTGGFVTDIVAVHGLGGDSFSTWTDKKTGKMWLKDFLPESRYFHNSRIMTFGYDARAWLQPASNTKPTGRSFIFSESLLGALRSQRILTDTQGRPIIFIGHSLGGIALVLAQARRQLYGDIYESTKSITFLGTPHQGSRPADWASYLEKISQIVGIKRSNVLRELETWSPTLLDLSRTFNEQLPRLLINSFYEKQMYDGVKVVEEGSATLSYLTEIVDGLDANHRTMCKFADRHSSVYRAVLQQLETRIAAIPKQLPEPKDTEENKSPVKLPDVPTSEPVPPKTTAGAGVPCSASELERRMKALRK
ncbi:hypothetical protein B0T22DRAFT_505222 [Podospora appendiculata]|uniref:DUF676 domain-containing protein n=1 Tax=Podospora appendiculata TaxID=314037 RepID=A0AAE1CGG9_9PEZI|nr:hypothetical protein B0T22DRAFT_505222 [Podospora appendiculata]